PPAARLPPRQQRPPPRQRRRPPQRHPGPRPPVELRPLLLLAAVGQLRVARWAFRSTTTKSRAGRSLMSQRSRLLSRLAVASTSRTTPSPRPSRRPPTPAT